MAAHKSMAQKSTTVREQLRRVQVVAASKGGSSGNESSDLKEREYRDAQGNVHHHTTTYMEQQKGEKDK